MMIGTELTEEIRDALVEFLKKNYDVFAWSQCDVQEIGPHVAVHKFFTNPDCLLFHHKRRKFAPKWLKVIEEEVSKLVNTNVIKESYYSNWMANVVVAQRRAVNGDLGLISLT